MNHSSTLRAASMLLLLLLCLRAQSQTWQRLNATAKNLSESGHFKAYLTDRKALADQLSNAQPGNALRRPSDVTTLILPSPEGRLTEFVLEETQLLQLTSGTPAVPVHTYSGYSRDKSELIHLSTYKDKIYGIVLRAGYTWYISTSAQLPADQPRGLIYIFDDAGRPDAGAKLAMCGMDDNMLQLPQEITALKPTLTPSTGCFLRTYRLAVGCTGEFTAASGSQADAIAHLTALINTVNAVFERDLGVRFTVVTNNNLIYTDPTTDPFNPAAGPCSPQTTYAENSFSNNLNDADYDMGIIIFYTNFGGCAGGTTCIGSTKGRTTAGYNSLDPTTYLGTVTAHELGHRLGAGHSHNANGAGCSFSPNSAWEVGGGSTIMAYTDCQPSYNSYNTFVYFHGGNIGQMKTFINSANGSCYTAGAVNTTPAINTPSDDTFFIPVSTPYRLYANATDAEDNNLTYNFEEMDLGTGDSTRPTPATAFGPIVRNFQPSTRSFRYVPRMDSILTNTVPAFELLSSVPRQLTYRTTVRDNHPGCGCTGTDTFLIKTTGTSPFQVTSQNTPATLNGGTSLTLTWDVAGTDQAPVNTQQVQILFAVDGLNYNIPLLSATPNNGTATVTVPNMPTTNGRIMVAAQGNLFFDINNADLTIQPACASAQPSGIWPQDPVTAQQGDPSLQLDLLPLLGQPFDTLAGEITATDPTGIIGFRNSPTDSTCRAGSGYSGRYDLFRFRVAQPGIYTVGRTLYTLPANPYMTIYGSGGLVAANAANACTNYQYGSTTAFQTPGGTTTTTDVRFTFNALRDSVYTLAILRRNATILGTYRIDFSGPAKVYPETQTPVGSYAYLVVNSTGTIIAISAGPPNLQSQGPGSYTVYGLSYSPSIAINSYLNQPFNSLLTAGFGSGECLAVSSNSVTVTITPTPLPYEYLKLTARQEQQASRLYWQTEGLPSLSNFQLEQSSDGRNFSPFKTLGKNEAKQEEGHYSYWHTGAAEGSNYYRVRANQTDGDFRYSNIAVVHFSNLPGLTIVPNPATSQVSIQVKGRQLPLAAVLTDMSGRILKQLNVDRDGYTLSLAGLAPGMYLLSGKGFAVKLAKR
ncbi:zinc-dependent metalloprotease [Taibaiella koreensis]|uniref:zinc-dependent metalloprotease n=1 Tax=Taibaiella koreensis TaxID=1268548 RepID=UPI000E59EC98|nr:zinc-dependent metalloprotease [Taibaiella koreensis]